MDAAGSLQGAYRCVGEDSAWFATGLHTNERSLAGACGLLVWLLITMGVAVARGEGMLFCLRASGKCRLEY